MADDPIKTGSADTSDLVFEAGSTITTSVSGVQTANIRFIGGDLDNLDAYMLAVAPGTEFNFGTYLPTGFKADETTIEYLEGRMVRLTVSYKRPDPNSDEDEDGKRNRTVSVDSVLKFSNNADGAGTFDSFAIPEPVVTVRYNTDTPPPIRAGNDMYILPGSADAEGFPVLETITLQQRNYNIVLVNGVYQVGSSSVYDVLFGPHPRGWQLIRYSYEPVAGESFYDVQEVYRTYFKYLGHAEAAA